MPRSKGGVILGVGDGERIVGKEAEAGDRYVGSMLKKERTYRKERERAGAGGGGTWEGGKEGGLVLRR